MKNIILIFAFIFTFLLTSCKTYTVETLGYKEGVKKFESVAILNTYVFPPTIDTPGGLVGLLSGDADSTAMSQIYQYNIQQKDTVANFFASKFKEYSGVKVLAGKELYSKLTPHILDSLGIHEYPYSYDEYGNIKFELPEGNLQLLDLSHYIFPHYTFIYKAVKEQEEDFAKICEFLQVDGLVIAEVHVEIYDPDILLSSGRQYMSSNIMFFDHRGKKICRGHINAKSTYAELYNPEIYIERFSYYYKYTDAFLRNFYLGEPYEQYLDQ